MVSQSGCTLPTSSTMRSPLPSPRAARRFATRFERRDRSAKPTDAVGAGREVDDAQGRAVAAVGIGGEHGVEPVERPVEAGRRRASGRPPWRHRSRRGGAAGSCGPRRSSSWRPSRGVAARFARCRARGASRSAPPASRFRIAAAGRAPERGNRRAAAGGAGRGTARGKFDAPGSWDRMSPSRGRPVPPCAKVSPDRASSSPCSASAPRRPMRRLPLPPPRMRRPRPPRRPTPSAFARTSRPRPPTPASPCRPAS